jgi:hypothetical protein
MTVQIETSLGQAAAGIQAIVLKRRKTPKDRPGEVGLRLHSTWLGLSPTTCSAKAKPGGTCNFLYGNLPPGE